MERYTVNFCPPGNEETPLLVVVPFTSAAWVIKSRVKQRLVRGGMVSERDEILLRAIDSSGPIIDDDDLINNIIAYPKTEHLYVTVSSASPAQGGDLKKSTESETATSGACDAFQVRVITPEIAQIYKDVHSIRPMPKRTVTLATNLGQLEGEVLKYLKLRSSAKFPPQDQAECNCSFARQIEQHGIPSGDFGAALTTLIVVYENNTVTFVPVAQGNLLDQVRRLEYTHGKVIQLHGGIVDTAASYENGAYLKLPVVSVCSSERHPTRSITITGKLGARSRWSGPMPTTVLDFHTSEAPIEITSANVDRTITELGLPDLAINGVLELYVVERKITMAEIGGDIGKDSEGKDGIFSLNNAWNLPHIDQSERGMAVLLSTLRTFSELTSAQHMDVPEQDAVLHVLNLLTRFPPAVRAAYILMSGKKIKASERAALAQSINQVLQKVVPLQLIRHDTSRFFEGSRLLFGLILEKAKHLKTSSEDEKVSPYVTSMRVIDLRNHFTMEPVVKPIQTSTGLLEKGYYEALKDDGTLTWSDGKKLTPVTELSPSTRRNVNLCGGVVSQVTIFDIDQVNIKSRYSDRGDIDKVVTARELSDIEHLAALCSRNKLSVLPPSILPSADHPALTLDRDGFLAVYVGRPACAEPGADIAIFRPTKGKEERVDVSIITQLLIPILEKRTADGTAIFESFGSQHRMLKDPDEIVVLCVDCSASMRDPSDFLETEQDASDEIEGASTHEEDSDDDTYVEGDIQTTLDDLKTSLIEHESFSDMLAIVSNGRRHSLWYAKFVIGLLQCLAQQEITAKMKELDDLKRRRTGLYYRNNKDRLETFIARAKGFINQLERHQSAICDFVIYRALNTAILSEMTWRVGDAIPKVLKAHSSTSSHLILSGDRFSVPEEYRCPISHELMDDPVTSSDEFNFERTNIERWFQIRQSSPLTGLVLNDTDLRRNEALASSIKDWMMGKDLVVANPQGNRMTLTFLGPLGSFQRLVYGQLTLFDCYLLAFRGMNGRHSDFELHCANIYLEPSETVSLIDAGIRRGSSIRIAVKANKATVMAGSTAAGHATLSGPEFEDLCLVKVFQGDYERSVLSYWTSKTTPATLASVVFRYWRKISESGLRYEMQVKKEFVIWSGLVDQGDSHYVGQTYNHWDPLSNFFTKAKATGTLNEEPVYDTLTSGLSVGPPTVDRPLVLKISLGCTPRKTNTKVLSRLDVVKQMFDAFVNRILAYNFNTHIGLVSFNSSASVLQSVTHSIEEFRHKLNDMEATGNTALWDAISLANDQLNHYSAKFPRAKKRILCLSDGDDNCSNMRAHQLSMNLMRQNVVVDSFCIGRVDNKWLRTLSYLSGGYTFQPESLELAMAICEMEPVLNQLERPPIVLPTAAANTYPLDPLLRFQFAQGRATNDIVTRDIYPQRKEHPNFNDGFVELATAGSTWRNPTADRSDSNLRTARVLTEMRHILANPHPYYDVYVSERNMAFWKVVMQGPPDSAYATGTFVLYLDMEENYPAFPPKGRFNTPIYHPNINRHGRICHSILDRNWTSDTGNAQVLNTIYSLLLVPEFSDPINAVVTLKYHWDEVQFVDEVKEHIQKHATKARAEWKKEILGL